jgi:AcrR family transcriptional regulator
MPRTKEVFQQIRDLSKQKILEKAAEVFANRGLANTRVSDLSEAASISQGLLYRYFTDKDDVFVALLDRAINGVTDYAQKELSDIVYVDLPEPGKSLSQGDVFRDNRSSKSSVGFLYTDFRNNNRIKSGPESNT